MSDINTFIKDRLNGQRDWYAAKARFNRSRYQTFQIIVIVATAIIPLVNLTSGWTNDPANQRDALLATAIISASVAVITAFTQMERYHETWILYRTTAETLEREKILFQNNCREYSKLSEPDRSLALK